MLRFFLSLSRNRSREGESLYGSLSLWILDATTSCRREELWFSPSPWLSSTATRSRSLPCGSLSPWLRRDGKRPRSLSGELSTTRTLILSRSVGLLDSDRPLSLLESKRQRYCCVLLYYACLRLCLIWFWSQVLCVCRLDYVSPWLWSTAAEVSLGGFPRMAQVKLLLFPLWLLFWILGRDQIFCLVLFLILVCSFDLLTNCDLFDGSLSIFTWFAFCWFDLIVSIFAWWEGGIKWLLICSVERDMKKIHQTKVFNCFSG